MKLTLIIPAFAVIYLVSIFSCALILRHIPKLHHNKILPGYGFKGIWKISLHECIAECGRRRICSSGNYFWLMLLCHLNSKNTTNVTLSDQGAVVFFEMSDKVREDIQRLFCGNEACDSGLRCSEAEANNKLCRIEECDDDPMTESNTQDNKLVNYVGARRLHVCRRNGHQTAGAKPQTSTLATSRCRQNGTWEPLPEACSSNASDIASTTSSPPQTTNATTNTNTPEANASDIASTTSSPPQTTNSTTNTSTPEGVCEEGWSHFDGYCFHKSTVFTSSWTEALDYCASLGSDLVCISKQEQLTFLASLTDIQDSYWTGGKYLDYWQWVPRDRSRARYIDFFNWHPQENEAMHFTGRCLTLEKLPNSIGELYYKSVSCNDPIPRPSLCQRQLMIDSQTVGTATTGSTSVPISTTPTASNRDGNTADQETPMTTMKTSTSTTEITTTSDENEDQDTCGEDGKVYENKCFYFILKLNLKWSDAKKHCMASNYAFASIHNQRQFDFFTETLGSLSLSTEDTFWIGGKFVNGSWYWGTDTTQPAVTFIKSGDENLTNKGNYCLALALGGTDWHYTSVLCGGSKATVDRYVICEKGKEEG